MSTLTTPSSNTSTSTDNKGNKSDSASSSNSSPEALSEDDLRKQLRSALQNLNRREPLDPTYKKLLERNTLTRAAIIPKNRFYRRIGSRLRERVETYTREMQGKDPFDRISQRKPLDEVGMRAAFTLREAKEHEQQPLLEATLAATAMHPERKRSLDGMALGLQRVAKKKTTSSISPTSPTFGSSTSSAPSAQMSKKRAELERQKQQAREWEEARMQRERNDKRKRVEEMEQNRKNENNNGGNNALNQIVEKVFTKYWDMVFPDLDNTNPFRIVIDRESAAYIAPDYFNVITTPMNLTYVKEKVHGRKYTTLTQFFEDIDLMIDNALKYNAQEGNPYRTATEELKKKHSKIVKGVWKQIKEKQKK
mmetsp:Transcript_48731/g.54528  ORF Transcript_48731/g.54528 Transcript_48731/m.54528 type:complete len:365 (+) Transcript_48731:19-1113(+)